MELGVWCGKSVSFQFSVAMSFHIYYVSVVMQLKYFEANESALCGKMPTLESVNEVQRTKRSK